MNYHKGGNCAEAAGSWVRLRSCVHCGMCLETCPTYRLLGNENNSPRGRLSLWLALEENRLIPNEKTAFYTEECLGCLACESVCPSNVPYGSLLAEARRKFRAFRSLHPVERVVAGMVTNSRLFDCLAFSVRMLRVFGLFRDKNFPGRPALFTSTRAYARRMGSRFKPTGSKVDLFTGCLMESLFREINFATVRVLLANNIRVSVPEGQTCCGAVLEHSGMPGKELLDSRNRIAFQSSSGEIVLTNSAGCGLSLKESLDIEVLDVLYYLDSMDIRQGKMLTAKHLYFDFPCHLYHGSKIRRPPQKVFQAVGNDWSLVPDAEQCCGSGGVYHVTHPENARAILKEKSAFLANIPFDDCILVTANHVCMMQWHAAAVESHPAKRVKVMHLVQVLDESYRRAGLYT